MRLPGKGERSHGRTAVTKLGRAEREHFVGWKGAGAARKEIICCLRLPALSVCLLHNNQHRRGQIPELIAGLPAACCRAPRSLKIRNTTNIVIFP